MDEPATPPTPHGNPFVILGAADLSDDDLRDNTVHFRGLCDRLRAGDSVIPVLAQVEEALGALEAERARRALRVAAEADANRAI
jgi:hypothetical protein